MRTPDGALWFSLASWVIRVNPRAFAEPVTPAAVRIQSASADKGDLWNYESPRAREGVVVEPGAGTLQIHFTSPGFVTPEKVRFKHRMAGLESEWQESGKPNIMPPMDAYNAAVQNPARSPADNHGSNLQYVIYYAYTELWFEKACDLWVAIGSDDFSKVWIEDQLVWSSGKNLKAWKLNEGLRKVHFKAGINRVLYRVENGNNKTEFSLVVSLQP